MFRFSTAPETKIGAAAFPVQNRSHQERRALP